MDFIDTFMEWTEGIPSPAIFRQWSAIACLAGALERRLWLETSQGFLYPNLYVLLVALPGIGKSASITHTEKLWYGTRRLFVAPDSVTSASLLDSLSEADRKILVKGQLAFEYHSLVVPAEEFGVLVHAHDLEFLARLNKIYDNPPSLRVRRKYLKEEVQIIHPQMTILAGAQPGYLATLLPEEAWSMGTTSRLLMINAQEAPVIDPFAPRKNAPQHEKELLAQLAKLLTLSGPFSIEPKAALNISVWYKAGCPPKPDHAKLANYLPRRFTTLLKLCMVASLSREPEQVVRNEDVERARDWLLVAEKDMPEIFKDMFKHSDGQIIHELHYYLWREYVKTKRPIHKSRIFDQLQNKASVDKIPKILDIMEQSDMIVRDAGTDLYTPRPLGTARPNLTVVPTATDLSK